MAMRISAEVKVVMGSTRMEFGDIAKLGPGAIIALNKRVSEPLDIVINGVVIARGHGCVTSADAEPCFGIILTELIDRIGTS
jgi:flagellar motor switch protein FliN